MIAMPAASVNCPVCGERLNVPLASKERLRAADNCWDITITPDMTEVRSHAAAHRDEADHA